MTSTAFARHIKATGYGHDIILSYGKTVNDEVIEFTADRIMSINLTWVQTNSEVEAVVSDKIKGGLREIDFTQAAEAAGITNGLLKATPGTSVLYNPVIDEQAAAVASAIDAVNRVSPEPMEPDTVGELMARALDRPSGAHLVGGNIIKPDGTLRTALKVPRLIVVQIFAPGEARQVTTDHISEKVVQKIEKASSIDELLTASEPVIDDLANRERFIADILEMRQDLNLMTGPLPGPDNGLAVPFEPTGEGFTRATKFAGQVRSTLPDVLVSVGRTWKRA